MPDSSSVLVRRRHRTARDAADDEWYEARLLALRRQIDARDTSAPTESSPSVAAAPAPSAPPPSHGDNDDSGDDAMAGMFARDESDGEDSVSAPTPVRLVPPQGVLTRSQVSAFLDGFNQLSLVSTHALGEEDSDEEDSSNSPPPQAGNWGGGVGFPPYV
jgi:hypothetical protein